MAPRREEREDMSWRHVGTVNTLNSVHMLKQGDLGGGFQV